MRKQKTHIFIKLVTSLVLYLFIFLIIIDVESTELNSDFSKCDILELSTEYENSTSQSTKVNSDCAQALLNHSEKIKDKVCKRDEKDKAGVGFRKGTTEELVNISDILKRKNSVMDIVIENELLESSNLFMNNEITHSINYLATSENEMNECTVHDYITDRQNTNETIIYTNVEDSNTNNTKKKQEEKGNAFIVCNNSLDSFPTTSSFSFPATSSSSSSSSSLSSSNLSPTIVTNMDKTDKYYQGKYRIVEIYNIIQNSICLSEETEALGLFQTKFSSNLSSVIAILKEIIHTTTETNIHNMTILKTNSRLIRNMLLGVFSKEIGVIKNSSELVSRSYKKIYNNLDKYNSFFRRGLLFSDSTGILDSTIMFQIYFILISSLCSSLIADETLGFKQKYTRKRNVVSQLPIGSNEINMYHGTLERLISNLSFGYINKISIYPMKFFFAEVFHIYYGSDPFIHNIIKIFLKRVVTNINMMKKEYHSICKPIQCIRKIRSYKLLNFLKKDREVGYISYVLDSIEVINSIQEELKNYIKNHLKDPQTMALFFKYRISSLLAQRLFILSEDKKNLEEYFSIFKEFLELLDVHFSHILEKDSSKEFSESEMSLISGNEEVLFCIILYLHINITHIHLLKIQNEHTDMFDKALKWSKLKNKYLLDELFYIRESMKLISEIIMSLEKYLFVFYSNRHTLEKFIYGYIVGDSINLKVKDMFIITSNNTNSDNSNETEIRFKNDYIDTLTLYEHFFKICKSM